MHAVKTLLWADSIAASRWFRNRSISRMIVAMLFFLVFAAVSYVLWAVSRIFFLSLVPYQQYGILTAGYIIHAAIIVVIWLAVGSSIASAVGMLTGSLPSFSYLLALPVGPKALSVWLFVKAVSANFLLISFAFVPIIAAYAVVFGIPSPLFMVLTLLMLLCIVSASTAAGMAVVLAGIVRIRGREYQAAVAGFIIFFVAIIGIFRVIFPPELSKLYDIPATTFMPVFNSLPLNSTWLPTAWVAGTITGGFTPGTILVLCLTSVLVILSLRFQELRLVPSLMQIRSTANTGSISAGGYRSLGKTVAPLAYKDWLSVSRVPSERGYAVFLGSVAVFFFLMLTWGVKNNLRDSAWAMQLTVFSYSWMVFFATAFFMRFLYPLVAREGKYAWYIFTLPVTRKRIINSKILLGVFFSLPVTGFTVIVWYLLPFAGESRIAVSALTVAVITLLAVSQVLFGAILPNFAQGEDPEKVTTSGMGLVTLLITGFLLTLTGQLIGKMMYGSMGDIYPFLVIFTVGTGLLTALFLLSGESMKRWQW